METSGVCEACSACDQVCVLLTSLSNGAPPSEQSSADNLGMLAQTQTKTINSTPLAATSRKHRVIRPRASPIGSPAKLVNSPSKIPI